MITVELLGYHIPKAEVHLLSPQVLLKTIGGQALQTTMNIEITLDNGIELCATFCPRSNLPILSLTTKIQGKNKFWDNALGYTLSNVSDTHSILSQVNTNLSSSQKELLLWHQHLLHALLSWIQILMRDRKWLKNKHNNAASLHSGPFITAKSRAHVCDTLTMKCAACLCAKAHIRSPDNLNPCRSNVCMLLKHGHVHPGDCISADYYISLVPGCLPHTFGQGKHGYTCGSLFIDHASGKVFNFCQYSTNANKKIKSAQRLESMARQDNFMVKKYHSDNGFFATTAFKTHCKIQQQEFSFSSVGADHKNGVAKRNIKTIAQWARANMLHLALHWPAQANISFWPQAIEYSVWVFNQMPNAETGISPNKIWSSVRCFMEEFSRAHVFGYPVYVLNAALQDGHKIPKWSPRTCLGLFLGFSDLHSSQVLLILNVQTGKISPQYHVIFDNKFETVNSLSPTESLEKQWAQIFCLNQECFLDVDYDKD